MKLILSEKQILTTIRLSGVQKAVLTKIIASQSEEQAYEQISDGRNMVAARDVLRKLGLIDFEEGSAEVTETGKKVMKDENLIDDSDQLTPDGQQIAAAEEPGDVKKQVPGAATDTTAADAGLGDEASGEEAPAGGEDELSLESQENTMTLLKDINENLNENAKMAKLQRDEHTAKLKKMDKTIFSGKNSRANPYAERLNKERKEKKLDEHVMFDSNEFKIIQNAVQGNDEVLDKSYDLMGKIQEFVVEVDPQWMPYGTQKARDGDPHDWIFSNLDEIFQQLKTHAKQFVTQ